MSGSQLAFGGGISFMITSSKIWIPDTAPHSWRYVQGLRIAIRTHIRIVNHCVHTGVTDYNSGGQGRGTYANHATLKTCLLAFPGRFGAWIAADVLILVCWSWFLILVLAGHYILVGTFSCNRKQILLMGNFFSVAHILGSKMARRSAEPQGFSQSIPCGRPLPSEADGGPAASLKHCPANDDVEFISMVDETYGPVHTTNNLTEKQVVFQYHRSIS